MVLFDTDVFFCKLTAAKEKEKEKLKPHQWNRKNGVIKYANVIRVCILFSSLLFLMQLLVVLKSDGYRKALSVFDLPFLCVCVCVDSVVKIVFFWSSFFFLLLCLSLKKN